MHLALLQDRHKNINVKRKKICTKDFDEIEIAKLKSKGSEKEKIANCVNGLVNLHANGQTIIEDDDDADDDDDDDNDNDDDDCNGGGEEEEGGWR